MTKRKILGILVIASVLTVQSLVTFANTGISTPKDNIEDYFDITSIGGKVISEEHTTYIAMGDEKNSIPRVNPMPAEIIDESKLSADDIIQYQKVGDVVQKMDKVNSTAEKEKASLDVSKSLSTGDGKELVDDAVVLNVVKTEEAEQLQAQLLKERQAKFTWVSDLGIDVTTLSNNRLDFLEEAHKHIGTWYVWGGTTPNGFDCSGYIQYCLNKSLGIGMPRTTYEQIGSSNYKKIPISEAKAGDIVFGHGIGHTGIFLKDNGGNITILHAPETGKQVSVTEYTKPSFAYRFTE